MMKKIFFVIEALLLTATVGYSQGQPLIEVQEKKPDSAHTYLMDLKFNYANGKRWWTFKLGEREFDTLAELKEFIKSLPAGSKIKWAPSDDRMGDEPLINSKSNMESFKKFCSDHGVTLIVIPGG